MYTKDQYSGLLLLAKSQGYSFPSFLQQPGNSRCIYLRHDVDHSLDMALELAKWNAALDVQGTFFLLLRSQVYNLLSKWVLTRVREIASLGQRLAFHCSLSADELLEAETLSRLVLRDFAIVRNELPDVEPVFSWHNPPPELLQQSIGLQVKGLINVYGEQFVKQIPYYSDSNMRHSVSEFAGFLKCDHRAIHLLFHPCNWVAEGKDMRAVLAKTWQYVIKEREYEIGRNATYQQVMPGGMPESILEEFSCSWFNAALQEKSRTI